jgi:TetR/AcrR family transcriptional regulator, transcriptional repressor of bet genes
MPRQPNTDARRAQIARALVKVMARLGYDGASITEIAAAARLTPGLVHYHFRDKQEILLVALGELVTRHQARLDERLDAAAGPARKLRAFIDLHLGRGAEADPEALACWVLVSGEALRQAPVRRSLERALSSFAQRLVTILRSGVAERVFRCRDVEAAAAALLAVIQGYFVLAASARPLIPRGSAARSALQMADGLLQPARPLAGKEPRR